MSYAGQGLSPFLPRRHFQSSREHSASAGIGAVGASWFAWCDLPIAGPVSRSIPSSCQCQPEPAVAPPGCTGRAGLRLGLSMFPQVGPDVLWLPWPSDGHSLTHSANICWTRGPGLGLCWAGLGTWSCL
jgi:hypothetical protein